MTKWVDNMNKSVTIKPAQRKTNIFSYFRLTAWFGMLRGTALPTSVMTSPYCDFRRNDKIAVAYFAAANSFKLLSCAYRFYVAVTHVFGTQKGASLFSLRQLEDMNWVLSYAWTLILIPGNVLAIFRTRAVLIDSERFASKNPLAAFESSIERYL